MSELLPIRDALLLLAADWREQAQEARLCAGMLLPFAASHKLAGQADLLERCAEAMEDAAAGKTSTLADRLGIHPSTAEKGGLPR